MQIKGGIRNIAEIEKLWESSVPAVVELRVWIEDVVLAIASKQQFCELTIKETGNVSCLNRSVAMKSVISIIRAHFNQRKAVILEDKIKDHSFHANQYTTGGKKGERDMKKKTQQEDLESRTIVKGWMKSTTLLDVVEETNNANTTKDDHERIDRIAANLIIQEENNHKKNDRIGQREIRQKEKQEEKNE